MGIAISNENADYEEILNGTELKSAKLVCARAKYGLLKPRRVEIRGNYLLIFNQKGTPKKVVSLDDETIRVSKAVPGAPYSKTYSFLFGVQYQEGPRRETTILAFAFNDLETANDWVDFLVKMGVEKLDQPPAFGMQNAGIRPYHRCCCDPRFPDRSCHHSPGGYGHGSHGHGGHGHTIHDHGNQDHGIHSQHGIQSPGVEGRTTADDQPTSQ